MCPDVPPLRLASVAVIEDAYADQVLIRQGLQSQGLAAIMRIFESAEAFLAEVARGYRPDIALVDINLPGMSGLDLVQEIRNGNLLPNTVIVFLTTSDSIIDKREAFRLGAHEYLVKPVRAEHFVRLVSLHSELWLGLMVNDDGSGGTPDGAGTASGDDQHAP